MGNSSLNVWLQSLIVACIPCHIHVPLQSYLITRPEVIERPRGKYKILKEIQYLQFRGDSDFV